MTITIFTSKDKEQKKITKVSRILALKVLDRIQGKIGWWAKAEYEDGDREIFHFSMANGRISN